MNEFIKQIEKKVIDNINSFLKEVKIPNLDNIKGKVIILNNSFMFREKRYIKTKKSNKYISFIYNKEAINIKNCYVAEGITLNKDYKIVNKNDVRLYSLSEQIEKEIYNLGKLIFILIGEIDESIILETEINDPNYSKVILNRQQKELVKVNENKIIFNSINNEEKIWNNLYKQLDKEKQKNNEYINKLKSEIANAFNKLKDKIYSKLSIPNEIKKDKKYFLDEIVRALKNQKDLYKEALSNLNKSNGKQDINEILRISYNFADDAITLIRLLVSISDLKPLIFWGTFLCQYKLTDSIRNIPWTPQITKPSLDGYIQMIKNSRNRSFHRLFPFNNQFEVIIPDGAIKNAKLKIFSPFKNKKSNGLDYEDKELIDVLTEFTITEEEELPKEFFEKNLKVINNTINLFSETSEMLKLCLQYSQQAES